MDPVVSAGGHGRVAGSTSVLGPRARVATPNVGCEYKTATESNPGRTKGSNGRCDKKEGARRPRNSVRADSESRLPSRPGASKMPQWNMEACVLWGN